MPLIAESERIRIVPGLAAPFFPMRPRHGRAVATISGAINILKEFTEAGNTVQPKLNGDRGPLVKMNDRIMIQNRHGSWYNFKVNVRKFSRMPDGTCLDGEVWKGQFYPFEVLSWNFSSRMTRPVAERAEEAERLCSTFGVEWIFGPVTPGWIKAHFMHEAWEGFVNKIKGTDYTVLGSASRESEAWSKHKWV